MFTFLRDAPWFGKRGKGTRIRKALEERNYLNSPETAIFPFHFFAPL